ncbi:hypothetical protein SDC9_101957 [bioreactor metagenome]|uniref:Uncharacterized protein n=1 Tax=bioreactor metagenome TaxID=1076179 RepID=A0A645B070_9ZZZZ
MVVEGSPFGCHQVVPAVEVVEVRTFHLAKAAACIDQAALAYQDLLGSVELLHDDTGKVVLAGTVVPAIAQIKGLAVPIKKERRVDPPTVKEDRVRPRPFDSRAGHQIVVHVTRPVIAPVAHDRIGKVEQPLILTEGEVGCPYPL